MSHNPILKVGRNCWRIRRANKVSFLIDGEQYFRTLYQSLPLAQEQILILAWDIYSELRLIPDNKKNKDELPTALEGLLTQLLKQKSRLHINILSWDFTLLFALSREWLPTYKMDWKTHRRLKFCLDDQYPLGASHHQKVVVIDDALAFSGGLDLTRGRWDTPAHDAYNPDRQIVDGGKLPVRPYHDVQMAVSGPTAAALGSLARERWRRGTSGNLQQPQDVSRVLWPEELKVDIEDVDVAIVRTEPAYGEHTEVREVEQLYLDSIAAAQNYIYIENQFFTAPSISKALEKRLSEKDGPEIILNLPLNTEGWLSQQSLDMIRVGLINKLTEADKHGHLAIYYPEKPGPDEESINLHAKIMIMDNCFARVGSANLNNRSMGLDSECDLAIEAMQDNTRVQTAIRTFRNRLLAEHLDCTVDDVNKQINQQSSVIQAIETLRGEGRSLKPLIPRLPEVDEKTLQDLKLTDPEGPVDSSSLLKHFVPEKVTRPTGRRIAGWIVSLLLLISIAAAWRFTGLSEWLDMNALAEIATLINESRLAPLMVIAAFVVGGLMIMPVTALIIVSVLIFGSVAGFFYALSGSVISALTAYWLGSLLGKSAIRDLAGNKINQVSKQLAQRGFLTMCVVRIVPVAPFTIINLVAGASHIKFRDFMLGTLVGMTPGILGITLLTDRVQNTIVSPDWQNVLSLIMVATVFFAAAYLLSRRLLRSAKHRADASETKPQ